jgi:hypothetical protein
LFKIEVDNRVSTGLYRLAMPGNADGSKMLQRLAAHRFCRDTRRLLDRNQQAQSLFQQCLLVRQARQRGGLLVELVIYDSLNVHEDFHIGQE